MIIYTSRLHLRPLQEDDVGFILSLTNDQDWLRYIGDKGIYKESDALDYINNARRTLALENVGPLCVCIRESKVPIGLCGLFQRDFLSVPDLGFAFLPNGRGKGYALEAASSIMENIESKHKTIAAIASIDNQSSRTLLTKLGFETMGKLFWHQSSTTQILFLKHR